MLSIQTLSTLLAISATALAAPAESSGVSAQNFDDTPYNAVLAKACVDAHTTRDEVVNAWQDLNCVLAAVGTKVKSKPIDSFLLFNFGDHISDVPLSADMPLPPAEVLAKLAYGGDSITAQSWVDAYYGALDALNSEEWPEEVSDITYFYDNVANWGDNCGDSIPNSEFGDYVKYSSSVNGGSGCMSIQQKVADGDVSTVTTPAVAPEQTAN